MRRAEGSRHGLASGCGRTVGQIVLSFGLILVLSSCTSEVVEPNCAGPLKLVLHGELGDRELVVEDPTIDGRWLDKRFYVHFVDPFDGVGSWVLEFGYNPPIADDLLRFPEAVNLAAAMQDAATPTFQLTNRAAQTGDPAQNACNPASGVLCAGLGMYQAEDAFHPVTDVAGDRPYDRYYPVEDGVLTLVAFTSDLLQAKVQLQLGWERESRDPGQGELGGCFKAQRRLATTIGGEELR